jgi:peroxiredoxin
MKEIKEMKEEIQQFLSLPKSGVLLDVRSEDTVDLNVFKGMVGTVVIFMCNHCPYVLHILDKLVDISREYIAKGISFIAISSNDIKNYPDDSPEKMKALAEEKDFPFPYLFDQSQEVAKSFGAVCTPDIFLYSSKNELFYHGQFDDSRPNSDLPVTGESLITAMDLLISGEEPPEHTKNCVGCSIKWYADEF